MRIKNGVSFLAAFAAWMIALVFSTTLQAGEIDLSKPVSTGEGKGSVVFSFTTWGAIQDSTNVKWHSLDGNGREGQISINPGALFGNETFSKTGRQAFGRFVRFELPAGNYEFYKFDSASYQKILTGSKTFSRRFVVEADKIQYIGNFDVLATQPVFSGGSILAAAFIGTWFGTVDVYPSLTDASDKDMPALAAQGVAIDQISKNILSNEEDMRTAEAIKALKANSEKGDLIAASRLLTGLSNGWFMSESGEEFKIASDNEWKKKLAEQLAKAAVPGGAFILGEALNPLVNKKSSGETVDGTQVLNHYLADAEKYHWSSVARLVDIYDEGIPGVAKNSALSKFWEDRWDTLKMPTDRTIPYLDKSGRAEFRNFLDASLPRYFAVSTSGAFGLSKGDAASAKEAITACEARNAGATERCRLYAKNRWLVWEACPAELVGPKAMAFPPATNLGKVSGMAPMPNDLSKASQPVYRDFLAAPLPRAIAVSDTGEAAMASGDCQAAYKALQACSAQAGKACQLYALDDQIVRGATDPKLVEAQQRLAALVEQASQNARKLAGMPANAPVKN